MTNLISRLLCAAALGAGLAGCATVPGDSYYEPAYYPAYGEQPVYIYNQPHIVRPYPTHPSSGYYGRPYYGDSRWDDRRPPPPGHWRDRDRDGDRDHHRDRDRGGRDHAQPDRGRPDRDTPREREPERKPAPPSPERIWRDARPPSQGQGAEDVRGQGPRPMVPGARQ